MRRRIRAGSSCRNAFSRCVSASAKQLGVSRVALSEIVDGRRGVSPEMAIRLSKAFGSRPEVWAELQMQFDLAKAMQRVDEIKVERFARVA